MVLVRRAKIILVRNFYSGFGLIGINLLSQVFVPQVIGSRPSECHLVHQQPLLHSPHQQHHADWPDTLDLLCHSLYSARLVIDSSGTYHVTLHCVLKVI